VLELAVKCSSCRVSAFLVGLDLSDGRCL